MWKRTSAIPALGTLRLENSRFKASLGKKSILGQKGSTSGVRDETLSLAIKGSHRGGYKALEGAHPISFEFPGH